MSPLRSLLLVLVLAVVSSCGSSPQTSEPNSTTTTERTHLPVAVTGVAGPYEYTLTLEPDGSDGVCVGLVTEPPVQVKVELRPLAGAIEPLGSPPTEAGQCLRQRLDADPMSTSFQPLFVPVIIQGSGVDAPLLAGVVAPDVTEVRVLGPDSRHELVAIQDGGAVIISPGGTITSIELDVSLEALELTVSCDVVQSGAGWAVATCRRL